MLQEEMSTLHHELWHRGRLQRGTGLFFAAASDMDGEKNLSSSQPMTGAETGWYEY